MRYLFIDEFGSVYAADAITEIDKALVRDGMLDIIDMDHRKHFDGGEWGDLSTGVVAADGATVSRDEPH